MVSLQPTALDLRPASQLVPQHKRFEVYLFQTLKRSKASPSVQRPGSSHCLTSSKARKKDIQEQITEENPSWNGRCFLNHPFVSAKPPLARACMLTSPPEARTSNLNDAPLARVLVEVSESAFEYPPLLRSLTLVLR